MCDDFFDEDDCGGEEYSENDSEDAAFDDEQCDYDEDGEYVVLTEMIENEILPGPEDLAEAIIFGSMIVGNAYEESVDRENRLKLLKADSSK